jgi:hypothetical protein
MRSSSWPSSANEDAVGQQEPRDQVRTAGRDDLHDATAEVVPHEHRALDPQVLEPGDQVPGLGGQRDVPAAAGRDAVAEPDQLECQAPRGGNAGHDVPPQSGVRGDAVHEHDRDAVTLLDPAHSDVVHDRLVLPHASASSSSRVMHASAHVAVARRPPPRA